MAENIEYIIKVEDVRPDFKWELKFNTFLENIEYIIKVEDVRPDFKWDNASTKVLIDLYKKYKKKLGTMELKTVKDMWVVIAKELEVALKKPVPASCCENRYKVLDRNYKKTIYGKKVCCPSTSIISDEMAELFMGKKSVVPQLLFADEMAELFMGKKSVVPQLLLSTSTIHEPEVERHMATDESIKEREITTVTNSTYKDVAESAINSENIRIRNRKRKAKWKGIWQQMKV
ncbi:hypothetical protein QE152_g13483 [Popillia japonica]|uniref:MADF domain-containing protein n=1 Tax=Popillia japonica TaxID=7064 RepID=A0AAW1LA16_POPJA